MQSLNNLSPRGRQILIGAITLFIVLPIFYLLYSTTSNSDPRKQGTYYDKGSGETVTNTNQTPETFGTDGSNITFLGVSDLLTVGVSKFQVEALKSALKDYGKTRSPDAKEFSITTKTIEVADNNEEASYDTVTFEIKVDRKDTYIATMRYFDLSSIQLTLKTKKGDLVYASKDIDGSTLTTTE